MPQVPLDRVHNWRGYAAKACVASSGYRDSRRYRRDFVRCSRRMDLEAVMNCFRGRAAPGTGRMPGVATRRSGATARSRNTAGGRFPGLPAGFAPEGRLALSQAAGSARTAARLAPSDASLLGRTRPLKQGITGSTTMARLRCLRRWILSTRFFIPFAAKSASVSISNNLGQTLKIINLSNRGKGELSVSGKELSAGTYYYTLIIDGKQAATKKMLVIR